MFFKKKDKTVKSTAPMPQFVKGADGNYRLDMSGANGAKPQETEKTPELTRIYLISRDNIKLPDAQEILLSTGNDLMLSKAVPLVWCAAYPDELFGKYSLQSLLLTYVKQKEGDEYLKKDSMVHEEKGSFNGYDYYILALFD